MKFSNRSWLATSLLALSFVLSSCTPEKARTLQLAAIQFKNESLNCINAMDAMRQHEIEPPPRSPIQVQSEFISNILSSSSQKILPSVIERARDPDQIPVNPETEEVWNAFVRKIKVQYETFTSIYAQLERGSFLASGAVEDSAKSAKILTVQLASFSQVILDHPPQLIQYQTGISAKLTNLRDEYRKRKANGESEQKLQPFKDQVGELLSQWEQVRHQEQELLKTTVTPCLQASKIGSDLMPLIDNYKTLDLNTLDSLIGTVLNTADSFAGQDLNFLKLKATTIISKMQADEELRLIANQILGEVNYAVRH